MRGLLTWLLVLLVLLVPGIAHAATGVVDVVHIHPKNGRAYYDYRVRPDTGGRFPVAASATPDTRFEHGDRVQATPIAARGTTGVRWTITPLMQRAGPTARQVTGIQPTLVILVNFAPTPTQPYTIAQAVAGYTALEAWMREVSYQQVTIRSDVVGWYTLPISPAGCDFWRIESLARAAATAAGVNLGDYVRHVYAFPFTNACGWAGLATVGGNPSSVWINGSTHTGLLAHEVGHTLGLYHSHAFNCHPSIVTTPCVVEEYGDKHDALGGGFGHFNAFQKQRLGWLGAAGVPPITTVTNPGRYALDAYELSGTAPKALTIARGSTGEQFYVELRRPIGWDAHLYRTGVLVHLAHPSLPNSSRLLDMTPHTSPLSDDAMLAVNQGFTDPVSGVTITTVSMSDTAAVIEVAGVGSMPLFPPTTLAAAGRQLTWVAGVPETHTGFVVERAPALTGPFASLATTTAPTYLDTGTSAETLSCYRVLASNASGVSAPSNVACTTTVPPVPPGENDVSATFTLTSLVLPQKLVVDVPGYRCIRQTGGSSLLKIARITGGVETALKGVGTPNPVRGVPFTIRCVVTASTVTLSLNNILKVTVTP